ncbi:hypothetical protein [Streptomyces osmaniensis]|uniref:Uncharacterized protein n=1 Tax=Streptomyces osmaniensis TaxID=593134 RepID=A0ABP6YX92_9ACTN|nr:hypothetical protein KJK32_45510 [Streptomyces sp. JCM17656]
MSEPQLPRPSAPVPASAMGRALHALTALFPALGEGSHELNLTADHRDGAVVAISLNVTVTAESVCVDHPADEYMRFFTVLTFALEPSAVHDVTLIAATRADRPCVCGWEIREGWLHPIDAADVRSAVTAHLAPEEAASLVICSAPVLRRPR